MDLIPPPDPAEPFNIYINTKTGNHRWDNGAFSGGNNQTIVAGLTTEYGLGIDTRRLPETLASGHVHFNGLHDAVDRTRPIGSVGWAGNQYSMLNSIGAFYEVAGGAKGYAMPRGLGAWHPFLRFSPYGNTLHCHDSKHKVRINQVLLSVERLAGLIDPPPPSGSGLPNVNWIATSQTASPRKRLMSCMLMDSHPQAISRKAHMKDTSSSSATKVNRASLQGLTY